MTDEQDHLKAEYRRLAKERSGCQQLLNAEAARWDGKGSKPAALAEAEAKRDAMDHELARIADKIKL
jgi:hypothetical protein